MKFLVTILALVAVMVGAACVAAADQQQQQQQQAARVANMAAGSQQASPTSNGNNERQGRSILPGASKTNQLDHGSLNSIDQYPAGKSKLAPERRHVSLQEFLSTKNIFKSIINLLIGSEHERKETTMNIMVILNKALDLIKARINPKKQGRDSQPRTIRETAEDAAIAGISILQGFVRSTITDDAQCARRYLCLASREAVNQSREIGNLVSIVGGYASSYMLDTKQFKENFDATMRGRSSNNNCEELYSCKDDLKSSGNKNSNNNNSL